MIIMDFGDSEYEFEIYCPNCGSEDVVAEYVLGIFKFCACKKCGFKKEKILDH